MLASVQNPADKVKPAPSSPSNRGTPFAYKKGTIVPPPIAAQAKQVEQSRSKTTAPIPTSGQADLPQVKLSELQLGKLLGHGSYSSAYEINSSNNSDDGDDDKKQQILKQLSPKVKENPLMFAACAADLIQEGQILHFIGASHANILDIYAWTGPNMIADYMQGNPDNCSLVLEQLVETLEDKLKAWKLESDSLWYFLLYEETIQPEYLKRLAEKCRHILGMAKALEHLHQHRVLHRDLKPANIGFNQQGVLKVFDFDLARVLPKATNDDDLFQMTPTVGSPRYMAPEIKLKQKYNCSADVYSFGILVYQMLTLEVPISSTVRDWSTHNKYIPKDWSLETREVMGNCLQGAENLTQRPSMAKVVAELLSNNNDKCATTPSATMTTTTSKALNSEDADETEIEETTTDDVADNCCDKQPTNGPEPEKKGWFW
mmetsp:Transcript_45112/g.109153  ORF Transcript_45112/g.109153 Transcript_45112/m.109153 type:complete len:431 (+) Transcript_45112:94-1386(+)